MSNVTAAASSLSARQLLTRRSASQMLDRRLRGEPESAVRTLLAVQAQDRTAWRLALRARVEGITAADVNASLTEKRSLLVAWLNRGTLHLVCADDYPWLLALTGPTLVVANSRRLAQEGLSTEEVERGVALIERSLASEGPLTRAQLRERLAAHTIRTEGQALVHLLFAAVIRGHAVLGPMVGIHHAFAHAREWLGRGALAPQAGGRDRALTELARRYLIGHGPATDADLAKWSGLPMRDVRVGLRAIGGELVELGGGLVELAGGAAAAALDPAAALDEDSAPLPPRLLPSWDPCTVGWRDREPFIRRADDPIVIPPGGGLFRPLATVDGSAAATWSIRRERDHVAVRIDPFRPLGDEARAALQAEAADIARFEGRTLLGGAPEWSDSVPIIRRDPI
jgi:hypothetical protein